MKYSLDKYEYFQYKDVNGKNTIAAMATYAGKRVKGYAKCDPRDTMDVEKGKELAAARCNAKIADKRAKRASKKYIEAQSQLVRAQRYFERMKNYYIDSIDQLDIADKDVEDIISQL